MQPEILNFFAKYIESQLGIVYADHNYFQLQNRLEEISKLLSVESVEKLHSKAKIEISGQFKQLLLDLATNNETSFFRDPKVFRAIESVVLPTFLQSSPVGSEFRIWSAASSTGQEALSLSMLLQEWNLKNAKRVQFSILGTDISERILHRAKEANYSQLEIQRGLPTALMLKYFTKNDQERWSASPELTKHIQFKKQNLLEPFLFPKKFDLILCRNVLIYQSVQSKKEILNRLTEMLLPGGFLILGSGESLLGLSTNYQQTASEGAVVYQKRAELQNVA
jgi:chemotaxis protein methyltransferase CheR